MGNLGREEVAASPARCFRDAAAEFAALAVFVEIAPVPIFSPQRLEQTGDGPKPRIERFVDAVFFENVCRDERQVVNGFTQFRGHASRSNGHEANSGNSCGNLRMGSVGQQFIAAANCYRTPGLGRPISSHLCQVASNSVFIPATPE